MWVSFQLIVVDERVSVLDLTIQARIIELMIRTQRRNSAAPCT
jgi:ABC-type dipeptide/oligopeptide/nickel transport system ATPase subunit